MAKLKFRATIENAPDEKCTDEELSALYGVFEKVMKKHVSIALPQERFELSSFPEAKAAGIEEFSLSISAGGPDQWNAVFEKSNGKKLKLYATLERD